MEGFKYTVSNMGIDFETQVRPRLDLIGKVFGIYNQEIAGTDEITQMCVDNNIRYALFSSQFEGETTALDNFPLVFEDRTVKIYKIY